MVETVVDVAAAIVAKCNRPIGVPMLRDIDYAAAAVKTAILEKFGRDEAMEDLILIPNERTISVQHGSRMAEGTRDCLIGAVHKAGSYDAFWKMISATSGNQPMK